MQGNGDRRVNRTRSALREALFRLAGTMDLAAITIKDLSEAADINRVTFYAHYRGVDELVEDVLAALIAEAEARLRSPLEAAPLDGEEIAALNLGTALAAIDAHAGFLAWALASPRGASLRRLLVASLKRVIRDRVLLLGADVGTRKAAVFLDYASEGITGVLLAWLEGGRAETMAELAAALSATLMAHPYETLGIAASPAGSAQASRRKRANT